MLITTKVNIIQNVAGPSVLDPVSDDYTLSSVFSPSLFGWGRVSCHKSIIIKRERRQ